MEQVEKKEVSAGSPATVAGVTLIPVEEVSINGWHGKGGVSLFGVKRASWLGAACPAGEEGIPDEWIGSPRLKTDTRVRLCEDQ